MRRSTESSACSAARCGFSVSPRRSHAARAAPRRHRAGAAALVGEPADWDRPAASSVPAQSVGLSPAATELRIATEDLVTELRIRGPELIAKSDPLTYADALHHSQLA